jgi:hypothetical protein
MDLKTMEMNSSFKENRLNEKEFDTNDNGNCKMA